jgi:hypothetical protein
MIGKMNIKKLVSALRSGNYEQGKHRLHSPDGFCCLGVACMLFIPEKFRKREYGYLQGSLPHNQDFAPNWLRSLNDDFYLKAGHPLSVLNDTLDYTFDEIADLLQLVYIEDLLGMED